MRAILLVVLLSLTSCNNNLDSDLYESKYSDKPTMQSAEDAMKKEFTDESFK